MDVYLARQPIYDVMRKLSAYELLYRADERNYFAEGIDGDQATAILVSDAITVFGVNNITNGHPAFINFTKNLLLEDFALTLSPKEVVIEILEDTVVDESLIQKVKELKNQNYIIALDDYMGGSEFADIIEYVDIIKVDFAGLDRKEIKEIAERFKKLGKKLLAEKVETEEDFLYAIGCGYELFQGYYFSKPNILKGQSTKLDSIGYSDIIVELSKFSPDFQSLTQAIKVNPSLTYKLLQYVNTLKFEQKVTITSIRMALVTIGINEIRRWMLLIMAREFCKEKRDELLKTAFIRGVFAEKLAVRSDQYKERAHEAFLMGVFSMMDSISGVPLNNILEELPLSEDVKNALSGEENKFRRLLEFVIHYEEADWDEVYKELSVYDLDIEAVLRLYLECVVYTDLLFKNKPEITT